MVRANYITFAFILLFIITSFIYLQSYSIISVLPFRAFWSKILKSQRFDLCI